LLYLHNSAKLVSAARKAFAEKEKAELLIAQDLLKAVDAEAAARLLSGAALNAALWIAASPVPEDVTAKAVETFRALASGLLKDPTSY